MYKNVLCNMFKHCIAVLHTRVSLQYFEVQSVLQYFTEHYNTVQHSIHCSISQNTAIFHTTLQYSTIQSALQYLTEHCSTNQCSVQYSTTQWRLFCSRAVRLYVNQCPFVLAVLGSVIWTAMGEQEVEELG